MDRRPFIVGNWKMNGLPGDIAEAEAIGAHAATRPGVDVALCPPATLIADMARRVIGCAVGGQDCHAAASGACTGSVSAAMLAGAGARLVIVGHSERRTGFGETDADVAAKAAAGLGAGLDVILCVGESKAVRDAGNAETLVTEQVAASLPEPAVLAKALGEGRELAIAYEPIWAIGTGDTATPADVAAMHAAIRACLHRACPDHAARIRILYGGSVNAGNAAELLAVADVDGALVGGASLTAASFTAIIDAAAG